MNDRRCPRAVAAGLLAGVALLAAACSDDGESRPPLQPSTTTKSSVVIESTGPRAGDHSAEIAEYKGAAQAALPSRTDVVLGSSDIVTGVDTPAGWQVQNQRGSSFGQSAAGGDRTVEVVCAGRGQVDVSVTVRTGAGDQVSVTPVPTRCSAQGATSQATFAVETDDGGFDVDVVPAEGAVAVLGWFVT